MDKYESLKNFIYEKNQLINETYLNNDDNFGNGAKEVFRRIIEEIEKIEKY